VNVINYDSSLPQTLGRKGLEIFQLIYKRHWKEVSLRMITILKRFMLIPTTNRDSRRDYLIQHPRGQIDFSCQSLYTKYDRIILA
jgi:hypothetical protein